MGRRSWVAAVVIVLVTLLAVPSISSAATASAPSGQSLAPAALSAASSLPAALQASWASRSGYVGSAAPDSGSAGPALGELSVVLTLWPTNLSLFEASADTARPLTAAEFDRAYSPSDAEYDSLIQYFRGFGLSIQHTWADRLMLTVEGPAARMGAAFGTTLVTATVSGRAVLYPEEVPALPSDLEADVSAVSGLSYGFSQFTMPVAPVASALLNQSHLSTDLGTTTTEVTPTGAHAAYDLDPLYNLSGTFHSAAGENIVLLLWGDGYSPSDLSTFFSDYYPSSFPAPTINAYPIDGAPEPSETAVDDPSDAPQELTLDMEWSGSMAPGATLDAVYAPDGPAPSYSPTDAAMEDALAFAVNNVSASVISMSFGLPETEDPSFQAAYTTLFAEAESRGITVVSASGDDGGSQLSHGVCTATPEVEFPASSPDVVAVGGTAPTLNVSLGGQITGIDTQPAWNLSGGGLSQEYTAPSWQLVGSAKTVIGSGGRGVPDVAGPAADNFIYYRGAVGQLAGTSFATPFWAGIFAEIDAIRGAPVGFVNPRLYAVASEEQPGEAAAFSDVTAGSNCLHSALPGWDEVTGWGTPRAFDLYAALTSTFVDLSVSASPTTVFPGGTTTISVAVLNATTKAPVPNISVDVSLAAANGYSGPCGGSFGATVAVKTNAAGTGSAKFSVPYCYFGSQAQVSAVLLSGGYYGQASATVTVSLLSGSGFLSLITTFPYNVIFFVLIVVLAILVGLLLSTRSHRQQRAPPSYPPAGAAAGPASPSWVRPAAPTGPPSGTPASAAAVPVPAGASSPATASPPGAASSVSPGPPPAPSSTAPSPMPSPTRCPACGTTIPAFSLVCPKCGLARP